MNQKPPKSIDGIRRTIVLVLSIALLVASGLAWGFGKTSGFSLAADMMSRIGLLLGALWLAWPSLRRPAKWLPPGIAVACVVGLMVLAAQPRFIVFVLPALGVLTFLASIMRTFRAK